MDRDFSDDLGWQTSDPMIHQLINIPTAYPSAVVREPSSSVSIPLFHILSPISAPFAIPRPINSRTPTETTPMNWWLSEPTIA